MISSFSLLFWAINKSYNAHTLWIETNRKQIYQFYGVLKNRIGMRKKRVYNKKPVKKLY